jgi:quercetin dioxygenase-like cupin family protein
MDYSRRDLGLLLPALAATAAAQQKNTPQTLPCKTYPYADMPVRVNGENKSRAVLDGLTHTGYHVDLHMTELGPGQAPHAPHQHAHEELVMLRSGALDVTFNGQTSRAAAGSVVFVASNVLHGWRNPGPERAEYFVIALGREGA